MKPLQRISISNATVDETVFRGVQAFDELNELSLEGVRLNSRSIMLLGGLLALQSLSFANTELGDELGSLVTSLRALDSLNLSGTNVNDELLEGFESLSLSELRLAGTCISDEAIGRLCRDSLLRLDLADTRVSDHGIETVVGFPRICWLDVSGTRITDIGINLLAEQPTLTTLVLCRTEITSAAIRELENCRPDIFVTRTTLHRLGSTCGRFVCQEWIPDRSNNVLIVEGDLVNGRIEPGLAIVIDDSASGYCRSGLPIDEIEEIDSRVSSCSLRLLFKCSTHDMSVLQYRPGVCRDKGILEIAEVSGRM